MNILKRFGRAAALGILFAISMHAQADDLQDANKLFKQGQRAQALEKVNAFLAANPKDAQGRFLKGLIYADQGDTADAITIFSSLTDDYPELPEPYNNLAVLYAGEGQYEKARSSLEMAIRTHPNYATAHENLGDIYAKMASQSYERALQLDKNNTSAKAKLALIRELLSRNTGSPAKPAAKAQAESVPASNAAASPRPDPGAEVLKATNEWADAWSARDSQKYLAYYAKDFKVPGEASRSAWEAQRKARIAAAKIIHVEIVDAKTEILDDTHVSVSFKQDLRTSHVNRISSKTLDWVKADGQWRIAAERSEQ